MRGFALRDHHYTGDLISRALTLRWQPHTPAFSETVDSYNKTQGVPEREGTGMHTSRSSLTAYEPQRVLILMSQERDLERAVKEFQAGINTDSNSDLITQLVQPPLWNYFRKNNLLRNEYEDLTQETLIRVFNEIKAFRFECRVKTWVFRIAETVLIDTLRRRNAKKRLGSTVSHEAQEGEENSSYSVANSLADIRANPEQDTLRNELAAICFEAIESLAPREREVLQLHISKDLSNREIAINLGISVETVRVTLRNARKKIRAYLNSKTLKK